jgi:AraC-like DNA-binding protein
MESYDLTQNFTMGSLSFAPVHVRIEQLRPVIAAHRHSHTSYEIHYTAQGTGSVTVEGSQYPIAANTLYMTGPDIEHSQFSSTADPVIEYCLYLNCSATRSRDPSDSSLDLFRDTKFWIGEDRQGVFPVLQKLMEEQRHACPGSAQMTEALLRQVIVLLLRSYQANPHSLYQTGGAKKFSASSQYPIVEDAFFYGYQTLQLEDLAALLHLSQRQTQRFLLEHYGMTFSQKRTDARMAAAAQLLLGTRLSILEIAEQVGFSSGEHFSTAFHRYYQQSPSSYRKNNAK